MVDSEGEGLSIASLALYPDPPSGKMSVTASESVRRQRRPFENV